MALIRLEFVAFVTCPAKPSELARRSRYAQQSPTFVSVSPNIRNLHEIWGVAACSFHVERGAMPLSERHKLSRLPKRFPVGTTFVVEGRAIAADGKNDENLRVFSRFVVLPGGRRIDLGGDSAAVTRSRRTRSRSRQAAAPRASAGAKKIVSGRGTTLRQTR
ncbi:MAG TPA: hypothetical protein VGH47_14820 [Xanthobacteraceae bacterium]